MAGLLSDNVGVDIFGLLGNIISFIVFLAPVPTFYRIYKKKSTEGFQSVPYVVALFSAMMWLYYATLKSNLTLLITINLFGCVIEIIYISLYIAYAPEQARTFTLRLLLLLNFGGFCLVLLLSHFLASKGSLRAKVLGWLCTSFAVSVFAAPLGVIRVVIRTKSVEFMPFPLSFFLTLSAVMWLGYGLFLKDLCVAIPNVLGLIFGVLQMVLYFVYKNKTTENLIEEQKLPSNEQIKAEINEKLDDIVLAEVQVIIAETTNNNVDATEKEKEKENIPDDQIARAQAHQCTCVINMDSPIINQSPTVRCEA